MESLRVLKAREGENGIVGKADYGSGSKGSSFGPTMAQALSGNDEINPNA